MHSKTVKNPEKVQRTKIFYIMVLHISTNQTVNKKADLETCLPLKVAYKSIVIDHQQPVRYYIIHKNNIKGKSRQITYALRRSFDWWKP